MKKGDITELFIEFENGSDEAFNKLFPLVYDQLKQHAFKELLHERRDHTFSKTDLVHEVYLKFFNQKEVKLVNRAHFFSIAASCMRQILVDHARKKLTEKRGQGAPHQTYIDELIGVEQEAHQIVNINNCLKRLGELNERLVTIVEMRYFGEMNIEEIASVINLSPRTVKRDWAKAKGWLYKELKEIG